jgi:SlyX protein
MAAARNKDVAHQREVRQVSAMTAGRQETTIMEERLMQLELLATEQEKTIGELSAEVAAQWRVIERMQKKLDALAERFLALEEQAAPETPVTRPPHW